MKQTIFILLIAILGFGMYLTAQANPSFFVRQNNGTGSTATTSVVYMSAGAATTTYYLDTQSSGTNNSVDTAHFLGQLTGSSTASSVKVAFEYSQGYDCVTTPAGCDWFEDRTFSGATTTQAVNLNTPNSYLWAFSSTSVTGGVACITTVNRRIFEVSAPTRYVRAVVTVPAGTLNSSFWGEFIGKKQAY